jgi:16S rRNA (guanine966-N2)-methyltransferase
MRIVGGIFRGRRLGVPAGRSTRPTTERTREALFNILGHGTDDYRAPEGLLVLDLFAGSGALGFEALSRGARAVTFIENDRRAADLIIRNAQTLGVDDNVTVLRRDARKLGPASVQFDLVLMDPPYGRNLAEQSLEQLSSQHWLDNEALIVVELGADETLRPPAGYHELTRRRYGAALLVFLKPA